MTQMASQGAKAAVVFLDPPRSGSTEEFIEAVALLGPQRVVYVSCSPETLARDLKGFGKRGYCVREMWPVDMFPMAGHDECVTLLQRVK